MQCPHRFVPVLLLVVGTACTPSRPAPEAAARAAPAASATRVEGTDAAVDVGASLIAIESRRDAATRGDAPVPAGRWLLQESHPPRAVWGAPGSEGVLLLSCDPAAGQLLLERQAPGAPEDIRVLTLQADGVRMDYPAHRVETPLAPMLATRIALDAPILDRLLMAGRMTVAAGGDVVATTAPGAPLRAVVEACRQAAPAD
jgi:hypothetical protein